MTGGTAARRFLVRGRVQGVGFRYFVAAEAERLGLAGITRNLSDGRVEVIAQGPPGGLDRFAAALRQGPALARVDGIEAREVEVDPARTEFRITH
jgi:acylphosphatase